MASHLRGEPGDSLSDFVAFAADLFGRDVYSSRRGARSDRVAALSAYCPHQLPELYLDYLEAFGADTGGLVLGGDLEIPPRSDVETLLTFHEAEKEDTQAGEPPLQPEKCFAFALGCDSEGRAFDFTECEAAANEPKVVAYYEQRVYAPIAKTFRNFLYTEAYLRARFPCGVPFCSLIAQETLRMQDLASAVQASGFTPYGSSDEYRASFERDGASVIVSYGCKCTRAYLSSASNTATDGIRAHLLRSFAFQAFELPSGGRT